MHSRVVRRAVATGTALVVALAGSAFADTFAVTSDLVGTGGVVDLGTVFTGSTHTIDPQIVLQCANSYHIDAGQTATATLAGTTFPAGGSLAAPSSLTFGPAPATWPADGQSCPNPAPVIAGPAAPTTIVVPATPGTYTNYSVLYAVALSPAGTSDGSSVPHFFSVNFRLTAIVNTPPTLDLPSSLTVEGNTIGGATVTYAATAADAEDAVPPTPTCLPASGAFFPLGTTPVTCTATDSGGLTTSGTFDVTVIDTIAPAFGDVPSAIKVATQDSAGATVSYPMPSAKDVVDPAPALDCAPASGSTFTVGVTTVTCTASDASGNTSTASFDVEVDLVAVVQRHVYAAAWSPPLTSHVLPVRNGRTIPVKVSITDQGVAVTDGSVELTLTPLAACPDSSALTSVAGLEALAAAGPARSAGALHLQAGSGRWFGLLDAGLVGGSIGSCTRADATVDGTVAAAFVLQLVR